MEREQSRRARRVIIFVIFGQKLSLAVWFYLGFAQKNPIPSKSRSKFGFYLSLSPNVCAMKWRKKSIIKSRPFGCKRQYLKNDSQEFTQIWHTRSLAGLEKTFWSSSWPQTCEGRSWDFGQGGGNGFWWIWTTFLKRLKSTFTIRISTNGQRHHLEGYLNYLFNTNFWGFGFYPPSSMQKMAEFFFIFWCYSTVLNIDFLEILIKV